MAVVVACVWCGLNYGLLYVNEQFCFFSLNYFLLIYILKPLLFGYCVIKVNKIQVKLIYDFIKKLYEFAKKMAFTFIIPKGIESKIYV